MTTASRHISNSIQNYNLNHLTPSCCVVNCRGKENLCSVPGCTLAWMGCSVKISSMSFIVADTLHIKFELAAPVTLK